MRVADLGMALGLEPAVQLAEPDSLDVVEQRRERGAIGGDVCVVGHSS
jgi:hypothetical protein